MIRKIIRKLLFLSVGFVVALQLPAKVWDGRTVDASHLSTEELSDQEIVEKLAGLVPPGVKLDQIMFNIGNFGITFTSIEGSETAYVQVYSGDLGWTLLVTIEELSYNRIIGGLLAFMKNRTNQDCFIQHGNFAFDKYTEKPLTRGNVLGQVKYIEKPKDHDSIVLFNIDSSDRIACDILPTRYKRSPERTTAIAQLFNFMVRHLDKHNPQGDTSNPLSIQHLLQAGSADPQE